ncbi:MAG: protein phosphatase 2C domain-containing protein [Lachnospiraceae bacterium]|nr:protein phosphatase 2C domain-containing protein [Lachnospiraceae bacterium]
MSKPIKLSYIAGAVSDRGTTRKINQDKICLRKKNMEKGEALFAIVCGGMGGLARGDVAANTVVREFSIWFRNHLEEAIEDSERIVSDWKAIIEELNERIWGYGKQKGIKLGTTLTVILLLPDGRYYTADVGDNRLYRIEGHEIRQENKKLAGEKRKQFQSLMGCSDLVAPYFANGSVHSGESFLLCTNGFYHMLFTKKLDQQLLENNFEKDDEIRRKLEDMIKEIMLYGEKDNISAVLVKVC